MGIRKIQITKKAEEIIKGYLFRGRYPTFQTITYHFSQWLREHTPGTPSFKPVKIFRKDKSNSEQFNNEIRALDEDIHDAYEATIEQTKQIMTDFNFIETERNKLSHELDEIMSEIDELMLMSNNADYRYYEGKVISFEDTADVNVSCSTALINIKNKEVTLDENQNQSNRIIINTDNVNFQPITPAAKSSALESIKNAFDDNLNTAWWHVIKVKSLNSNNNMKAELNIVFDKVEDINCIEYMPHNGKSIEVKLEYTTDGSTYTPITQNAETDTVTGLAVWSFQKIAARGIKFVLDKNDYDERSGDYYNYYFGAKNIKLYRKNYLSEGIIYSNPIEFDSNVEKLTMTSESEIPFNTDIQYEVALYESDCNLEELIWHPISSYEETKPKHSKVINLNAKENRKIETSKSEATGEVINGMKVFRLMKENGDGIMSESILDAQTGETTETFDDFQNPKLFRGINQWRRERTYLPFTGSVPLNSQWDDQYINRPDLIRVDYFTKSNQLNLKRTGGGFDDNFYRFSICIYSDEPRTDPLSLSVMSTLSSGTRKRLGAYSVYVNRQRLAPVNDEVTLPLQSGWNEIQILYHWGDMQERKDTPRENLPQEAIIGKFNFYKETIVRADINYMEYVDVHSLYHNISPNNRDYFSIYEQQVVLNYLPVNCTFQLMYETSQQQEHRNQIILRAILKRDINVPQVTPKIHSIRLRVK
ncbi:discoidin domain-containing protein [Bacillus velezensis]|uniref:discoidin domain-containing protein n=1 Tax=Bacillus velezensis TaxID=492670 RepID=UPI001E5CF64D|nr:discoidin domain-containing protein [Bacillus velezensis]MCD7910932.1 discoidin domain-containing protein [Bacillus velezensis]